MKKCNCDILFDQDCEDEYCKREVRTAVFDYMICLQLEDQFDEG